MAITMIMNTIKNKKKKKNFWAWYSKKFGI